MNLISIWWPRQISSCMCFRTNIFVEFPTNFQQKFPVSVSLCSDKDLIPEKMNHTSHDPAFGRFSCFYNISKPRLRWDMYMEPFSFHAISVSRRKQLSKTPYFPFSCLFSCSHQSYLWDFGERREGRKETAEELMCVLALKPVLRGRVHHGRLWSSQTKTALLYQGDLWCKVWRGKSSPRKQNLQLPGLTQPG